MPPMNKIEKAIIKTLVYFDLLARPLTLDELWHQLYRQKASKLQVFIGLKKLIEKKLVGKSVSPKNNIYYYLSGRSQIAKDYFVRFNISLRRWQKIEQILKVLKFTPFIRSINVINSLSYHNCRQGSDIDILLVAKKGRLWTARALAILLLEIIGQNKNQWYQAGKICLGFAFDEDRLALSSVKFPQDIDFTYWLANLTPIYDRGIYQNLIRANSWLKEELPNWEEKEVENSKEKAKRSEKLLSGKMGEKLENWLAKIQLNRIRADRKNKRPGASVIADASMMKLHAFDVREERQKEWEASLDKISKNEIK